MNIDKKIHLIYFADEEYFDYFLFSIRSLLKLKFKHFGNIYLYVNKEKPLSDKQLSILEKELPFVIVRKSEKIFGPQWGLQSVKTEIRAYNEIAREVNIYDYLCKIDADTYLLDKKIFSKVIESNNILIGYEDNVWKSYTFTQGGCYFIKASFIPNLMNFNNNIDEVVMKKLNSGPHGDHIQDVKYVPEDAVIHEIIRNQTADIKFIDFMISAWENPFQKKVDILHFSSRNNKNLLNKVIFKPKVYVVWQVYLNYFYHKYKNKMKYVYVSNLKKPLQFLVRFIEQKRGVKNIIYLTLVYLKDVIWTITSFSKMVLNILLYKITKNVDYIDRITYGGNYIIFFFDGDEIKIERMVQFESRGDSIKIFLEKIILEDKDYFKNKRGIVTFHDGPHDSIVYRLFDIAFSTTLRVNKKNITKPFPCFAFESWPQIGVDDSQKIINDFIYNRHVKYEDNRIFWIGTAQHYSRIILNNIAKEYPDVFDVTLMDWQWSGGVKLKPKVRYVSIPDHAKYKYLIDCPGNSGNYSARLKWLLATGRPVFIVEREVIEWWHKDLIPFIHYIPVKEDLSDLIQQYEYIESHPELYEKISKNAIEFARAYFNTDALVNQTLKHLN